ncbi:aspartate aminotransferase family protein [Candidatus Woesearchaeota archaeon]|nr:aspartate aminotransferase family protein [Candidatus Woesearchaeota archaeon]
MKKSTTTKAKEFLFRDAPTIPLEIVDSGGRYIIDKDGKPYLDFTMGWCVGNAGWKKKAIINAVKGFQGPDYVQPNFLYKRWDILAEKLVCLLPHARGTCFRATGGTEANEIALKIARAYNKRKKFLAFKGAYHGQSLACLSLVRIPEHEEHFGTFSEDYLQISTGDWATATQEAVQCIGRGNISAFISEPFICNLGVLVPPQNFFDEVMEVCKKTNTLFICDEVATGFGRTGKWFGFEHYTLDPDIITIAKGFSSGYGAIGATIAKPEVAEAMRFEFSNYSTFGWHPLAVEAAIANINYLQKENLPSKAKESGVYLMKKLSAFCKPEGNGLCIGFNEPKKGTEIRCRKNGLMVSSINNRIVLFPALDVTKKEIDQATEILRKNV